MPILKQPPDPGPYKAKDWRQMVTEMLERIQDELMTLEPLMSYLEMSGYKGQGLTHPATGESFIMDHRHRHKYWYDLSSQQRALVESLVNHYIKEGR